MIGAILAVCALIVVWVVIGWGREARRKEEARTGPPHAVPYDLGAAFRTALKITGITAAVVALIWWLG